MPFDRSTVIKGPAIMQRASYNYYTAGDITVSLESETADVILAVYGKVDERLLDRAVKVSFTPTEIEEASLTKLWPYGSTLPGTSLFTGTDVPLVIYTLAGKTITFTASALTKLPGLHLSTNGNLLKAMEFTCIGKNNAAWTDAASIGTVATLAFTDPASFLLTSILNQIYTASWAASGAWASFTSEDGFDIDFELSTNPQKSDAQGTFDYQFNKIECMVKCKPFPGGATPIAEAELLAGLGWQGTGATRGKSLAAMSATHDLVIDGNATPWESPSTAPKQLLTFTLKGAAMKTAGMQFGATVLRNGEVGWIATRTITGGTVSALYTAALT